MSKVGEHAANGHKERKQTFLLFFSTQKKTKTSVPMTLAGGSTQRCFQAATKRS